MQQISHTLLQCDLPNGIFYLKIIILLIDTNFKEKCCLFTNLKGSIILSIV